MVLFAAAVSCKPEPEVTWYFGQEKQASTDRYRVHRQKGGVHVFEIRDLRPSDAGEWRALAFNSYGQTLCSCTIKVIGQCEHAFERPAKISGTLESLQNTAFDCQVNLQTWEGIQKWKLTL